MIWREQYERSKARLLSDPGVCPENRQLFGEFFAFEEYKLKRQNGLPALDEGCYKTLYGYVVRLRNVNRWFENKPWRDLTREDIRRVYDALEDGTIRNQKGLPFRDPVAYYNKVFKSKPFRLAGKAELAKEVIEFSVARKRVVRFVSEESFRAVVSVVSNPTHRFLLWLAWDIGENINTLLQLERRDFMAQVNRHTGEREYLVRLAPEKLKRSRRSRSEVTLYPETVRMADMVLPRAPLDGPVFGFGYRYANTLLSLAVRRSGATTLPDGQPVRWKDLRSGMACHLLTSGWSCEEINARLGHAPHSPVLNAYLNVLALDRERPKERLARHSSETMRAELARAAHSTALVAEQSRLREQENVRLAAALAQAQAELATLKQNAAGLREPRVPARWGRPRRSPGAPNTSYSTGS
jgi:integrase